MGRLTRLLTVASVLALVVACSPAASAPSASASPTAPPGATTAAPSRHLRVGFVADDGHLGDKSLNDSIRAGVMAASSELGIEPTIIDPTNGDEYESDLRKLAKDGNNLIFAVNTVMTTPVLRIAREFPDTNFALVNSSLADLAAQKLVTLPNVTSILFHDYEGGYLAGLIAAEVAKARIGSATHNTACESQPPGRGTSLGTEW